jgi:hypothetical protein
MIEKSKNISISLGKTAPNYLTMNANLMTKPNATDYLPSVNISDRAQEQKAHNFKITYDESNGLIDDMVAQPRSVNVSCFKLLIVVAYLA